MSSAGTSPGAPGILYGYDSVNKKWVPIAVDASGILTVSGTVTAGSNPVASVYALSANVTVDVLTVLLAFTDLSAYAKLLFWLQNTGAVEATYFLETAEDASFPDENAKQQFTLAAGKGSGFTFEGIRKFWRISAQTAGASTTVKWLVRGVAR